MTEATLSVLQPWVADLPWKRQSEFLSALRGPDNAHSPMVKRVTKLLRAAAQYNADDASGYMRKAGVLAGDDFEQLEHELEYCTLHFVAHLVVALSTVTKHCPDDHWRDRAAEVLVWFTDTFHLEVTE